jgi:Zn-dependent peptidase ImmA (M78 family)
LANVAPSPSPSFLPRLGDPAAVANRILRYFDFKLPLLEEMAHVLGTQVISAELPNDVLGLFVTNTDAHHSAILVNRSSRSEGSQRFTIAHELGHYLLHSDSAFLCGYREVYEHQQELETEANSFAAELLMPTAKMRDLTVRRFDCTRVSDIAQRFNCSTEAAARRFIDIAHNRQLALVVVRNGQVLSVAASIINQQGVRWFGRPSAGQEAVCFDEALHLRDHRENRLGRYLPAAQANWLNDLDIDMYPFRDGDGYYLFIERS